MKYQELFQEYEKIEQSGLAIIELMQKLKFKKVLNVTGDYDHFILNEDTVSFGYINNHDPNEAYPPEYIQIPAYYFGLGVEQVMEQLNNGRNEYLDVKERFEKLKEEFGE